MVREKSEGSWNLNNFQFARGLCGGHQMNKMKTFNLNLLEFYFSKA